MNIASDFLVGFAIVRPTRISGSSPLSAVLLNSLRRGNAVNVLERRDSRAEPPEKRGTCADRPDRIDAAKLRRVPLPLCPGMAIFGGNCCFARQTPTPGALMELPFHQQLTQYAHVRQANYSWAIEEAYWETRCLRAPPGGRRWRWSPGPFCAHLQRLDRMPFQELLADRIRLPGQSRLQSFRLARRW